MKQRDNVRSFKKRSNPNIGMIFFAIILIYMVICICIYFTQKHVYGYEVKEGSLSVSNVYEGFAVRDETVVNSDYAGYVNYFAKEGDRAGANRLVCTVDETGQIKETLTNETRESVLLENDDLTEIKTEVEDFSHTFEPALFFKAYDFKSSIQGSVQKYSNINLLSSISELSDSNPGNINVCNAPQSGIVVYSVDGYENVSPQDVNASWFDRDEYNKKQFINNQIVAPGDPVYKLSTNENWCILIQTTKERAEELLEEEYVKVKFLKNQYESWGKVSVIEGSDEKTYVKLAFNNSMVTFASDRFIDVELITDVETGLKVPNSAIVEKEFFLIPSSFVFKGGKNGEMGVLRQTYTEDGTSVPEFVEVSIYNEEDDEYYVDDSVLRIGDILNTTDSTDTFTVSKAGTLMGVYNINKGYADFKQIQILNQNEEYSIIRSNTSYGLVTYDYIVLDADAVGDNELIYE